MKSLTYFYLFLLPLLCGCYMEHHSLPLEDGVQDCTPQIELLPFTDTCFQLPPGPTTGWVEVAGEQKYFFPSVNPANNHQLLYLTSIDSFSIGEYRSIDLCTKEQFYLFERSAVSLDLPVWGYNNWIYFIGRSENNTRSIWKVKSNGEQLSLVNDDFEYEYLLPIPDNQLIAMRQFPEYQDFFGYRSVILNPQGDVLDTLPFPIVWADYRDGKIATASTLFNGNSGFGWIDLDAENFIPANNALTYEYDGTNSIAWLNDEEIILSDRNGIHRINLLSGAYIWVKEDCSNNLLSVAQVLDETEQKIIFHQFHYIPIDDTYMDIQSRLFQYDLNTDEQWEIILDE